MCIRDRSQYVLPPLLALFNRHYPEIRIRLKSGNTEEIEQAVQDEACLLYTSRCV